MKKDKTPQERKPDLNSLDDQQALEDKVREMLDLEEPKPKEDIGAVAPEVSSEPVEPKKITITHHEDTIDEPAGAPEIVPIKSKQKVAEETKAEAEPEIVAEQPTEEAVDLNRTIEELNKELQETTTDVPVESEEGQPAPEPEEAPIVEPGQVAATIQDPQTEKAVEDIIAEESDALLSAEDTRRGAQEAPAAKQKTKGGLRRFFKKKSVRFAILFVFLAAALAVLLMPQTRYTVLNKAGVRSSASVVVQDSSTLQPLRNVRVAINESSALTDNEGRAQLNDLELGPTKLIIEKRAFAVQEKDITIGWGSNPLGDFSLEPSGSQYAFVVTDYASGKPLPKVEAVSDDASAFSDQEGKIKLTIEDDGSATEREVELVLDGYRKELITLNLDSKDETSVAMVPDRQHAFVSKRNGRYDVYKIDIDGKNETLVLPGTGSERDDMVLVPHPTKNIVALVSTRENKRNKDGFLLSMLTIINLDDNTNRSVGTSERVQAVDWIGDRIVYVQVAEGTSAASPDRHRLMSYDYEKQDSKELAKSNYFNDVMIADKKVYYAPSSAYTSSGTASLFRSDADGANRQTVLDTEVWNIFRLSYDRLTLALQQQWYEFKLFDANAKAAKISEPANTTSRIYVDSPNGKKSLWVDSRDGKGVLVSYDTESKQDTVVRTQSGLKNPVSWITDDVIVFRAVTESETADYVMSLSGGEPKKLRDVSNTGGIDRWYYY